MLAEETKSNKFPIPHKNSITLKPENHNNKNGQGDDRKKRKGKGDCKCWTKIDQQT